MGGAGWTWGKKLADDASEWMSEKLKEAKEKREMTSETETPETTEDQNIEIDTGEDD